MMHVVHSRGRHSPRRNSDSSISVDETKNSKRRSSIGTDSSLIPTSTKSPSRKKESSDSRKNANKIKGRNPGETLQRRQSQALDDSLVFSTSVIFSGKGVKNRRNSLGSKNEPNDSREWKISRSLKRNHSMTKIEMNSAPSPDATTTRTRKQLNNVQRLERRGSLFDVFVWSKKENVDKLMERKKKLNHTRKPKTGYECRDSLPSLVSLAFEDDEEGTVSTEDTTDNCNHVEKVGGIKKCSSEAKAPKVNSSPLVSTAVSTSFRVDNDPARDENVHEQNAVERLQLSAARTLRDEEFAKTQTGSAMEYFENLRSRWDSSSRIVIQADPAMPYFRRGQERRSNQHRPPKPPNSSKRSKAPRAPKTPRPSKKTIGNEADAMPLIP